MAIKKTTTVEITRRKVNGEWQYFFRTAVPKDIGIEILGLNIETLNLSHRLQVVC